MFIFTLNARKAILFLILALILVFLLGIFFFIERPQKDVKNSEIVACSANLDNSKFVAFLASSDSEQKNIEIFDIIRGEVIKVKSLTEEVRTLSASYVRNVKSLYVKVNAFPNKGYIVKIPQVPPLKTQKPLFTDYGINTISELFVIFPEQEVPYLLVLDKKYNPFFYNFEGNTEKLLSLIELEMASQAGIEPASVEPESTTLSIRPLGQMIF